MQERTSTQTGALGEHIAAARLILESKGRLSPFFPLADDDGIDLILYDKVTGRSIPIQVKTRSPDRYNFVQFQVRRKTFRADRDGFLLGILLSDDLANIDRALLVPFDQVPVLGSNTGKYIQLRPAISMRSRDKYRPYFYDDMAVVVAKLISIVEGE